MDNTVLICPSFKSIEITTGKDSSALSKAYIKEGGIGLSCMVEGSIIYSLDGGTPYFLVKIKILWSIIIGTLTPSMHYKIPLNLCYHTIIV